MMGIVERAETAYAEHQREIEERQAREEERKRAAIADVESRVRHHFASVWTDAMVTLNKINEPSACTVRAWEIRMTNGYHFAPSHHQADRSTEELVQGLVQVVVVDSELLIAIDHLGQLRPLREVTGPGGEGYPYSVDTDRVITSAVDLGAVLDSRPYRKVMVLQGDSS